ncbi:hypothetical protein DW082_00030 [Alistipes sp. AF48-12]|jgi:poly(beta-D-mannuronate) C5 epimerase 2|uniref:glycosyl hydrolase family 28-related protein n=1 Tax=Alistipes sp. AF48-12 TaxID=2291998 RepID=UPI000E4E6591|nr:glycosyl hydrolase family 28-related protein [Alistipes sp. AF48-12]RHO72693.1 hypothetical protein DW082_00030 [Alistipes sp. AF48-12]
MKKIFYVACAVLLCACAGRADRSRAGAVDPMKTDGGLVYDVKNFGAVGDGVTDDTRAIQAALDYAVDHGGGTVYFPNGLYRLATLQDTCKVRAHLIVKPRQSPGRRDYVMIRLQGESSVVTPCSYASHTAEDKAEVWRNGTVLVSDAAGELQTDPAQAPVSVLAAGAGDNLYLLNQAVVRLQDLAFQVKAEAGQYPYLSGVNMAYAATVYTDNILIYSSIRNMVLTSPTRDGHYSAGFIAPRTWCNPEQDFRNICVKSAFRFGFVFSEHANGNNLSAWNCDNAFVFSRMDHSAWFGRIHAQNCANIVSSLNVEFAGHGVGDAFLKIEQVGIEVNSGQKPVDFNYRCFVDDPENHLYGTLHYHIVKSNVGADNSYFKADGGAHLKASPSF